MKTTVISFVVAAAVLATGACSKNQLGEPTSQSAAPSDSVATVTMSDGSRYRGSLVSKNGSEMTFRGTNGATRTFDSRDIKNIAFADISTAPKAGSTLSHSTESGPPRLLPSAPPVVLAPAQRESVISTGTAIAVRNDDRIDSKTASAGQTFSAVVVSNVLDETGRVAIPRGAAATLVVAKAGAGKIHANDLALDLISITVNGTRHEIQSGTFYQKGKDGVGANKRTGLYSGGGAGVGALIGGIVGGGKGAAIGAASGAGAGAGTQILTRGSVKIPSESLLTFRLEAPLAL